MTRSIAEVIGWKYHPGSDAWKAPGRHEFRFTYDKRRPPDMTADDLLDWLREQSYHADMWADADDAKSIVTLWARFDDVRHMPDSYEAPTLLAALELAVRAVAGES